MKPVYNLKRGKFFDGETAKFEFTKWQFLALAGERLSNNERHLLTFFFREKFTFFFHYCEVAKYFGESTERRQSALGKTERSRLVGA